MTHESLWRARGRTRCPAWWFVEPGRGGARARGTSTCPTKARRRSLPSRGQAPLRVSAWTQWPLAAGLVAGSQGTRTRDHIRCERGSASPDRGNPAGTAPGDTRPATKIARGPGAGLVYRSYCAVPAPGRQRRRGGAHRPRSAAKGPRRTCRPPGWAAASRSDLAWSSGLGAARPWDSAAAGLVRRRRTNWAGSTRTERGFPSRPLSVFTPPCSPADTAGQPAEDDSPAAFVQPAGPLCGAARQRAAQGRRASACSAPARRRRGG